MIHIEISDSDGQLNERTFSYKDKKTGESREGVERSQVAYLHNGGPYPQRFKLSLGRDETPHAPGMYEVSPDCVVPGRFDGLQFKRRLEMKPIKPTAVRTGTNG